MVAAEKTLIKPLTYEDWLATPEINQLYEVIDGVMVMCPAPTIEHQWLIANLTDQLRPFVKKRKLGAVLAAPLDVLVRRAPLRTRQPDVLFISFERSGQTLAELRKMPFLEIAPDLAVEILSPSDRRGVLSGKLQDYCKIGVRECWLVSPEAETIEVLRLSAAGATRVHLFGAGDTLRSEVLPDFKMKVDAVFA